MNNEEKPGNSWAVEGDKPARDEQDAILARLSDMFGELVSSDNILTVCNLLKWQLEDCIEALISLGLEKEENTSVHQVLTNPENNIERRIESTLCSEPVTSAEVSVINMGPGSRNLGAIPKYALKANNAGERPHSVRNVNQLHPNNMANLQKQLSLHRKAPPSRVRQLEPLLGKIRRGYKILVLMRGPPGSGKSHLAKEIVQATVPGSDYRNHIFSTDDYFIDRNGNYIFRPDELSVAHATNQRRVHHQAMNSWSPIIVDNTNIRIWEMSDYVKIAVECGYLIEIVEPRTPWSQKAGKLAEKNRHGVPKEKIQSMLDNYEKVSVPQLLKIYNCKYSDTVPQLRLLPSVVARMMPKMQRQTRKSKSIKDVETQSQPSDDDVFVNTRDEKVEDEDENNIVFSAEDIGDNWKSYEEESEEYWQEKQAEDGLIEIVEELPKPPRRTNHRKEGASPTSQQQKDLDTRENENQENETSKSEESAPENDQESPRITERSMEPENVSEKLEKHVVGCENENQLFATLRQIYPNKQIDGLWDLFEKCQGNIDWTVDILLKDDSCVDQQLDEILPNIYCNCKFKGQEAEYEESAENVKISEEVKNLMSPKKQRVKRDKSNKNVSDLQDIKKSIEMQFVLGDQHYSERTKRIRNLRHGMNGGNDQAVNLEQTSESDDIQVAIEAKENDDMVSDVEEGEVVEIVLGDSMVEQLSNMFELDLIPKNMIRDLKTNVFIPKSLAYQLYLIWVESVYNQVEEQKYKTLKEDEELAKMLSLQRDNKQCTDVKSLGEELVTQLYSADRNSWDSNGEDLASHLTKLKLCEQFPKIGQQTLFETLGTLDNRYEDTVQILQDTFQQQSEAVSQETETQGDADGDMDMGKMPSQVHLDSAFSAGNNLSPEEAKKIALHNFEINRNMAVHHSQLKAECYQKAKQAIQRGNTAVAVYYSQIADLHKQKVDTYNHTAANYIVAVHDVTQNNPDFIDLHYLHVSEAEQCLDVFVDKHIRKLKSINKAYKYIFIITGRGLHSAGGVSIIKNKVKSRLKERNLNWTELNPGLLKVKVFSTSKFAHKTSI